MSYATVQDMIDRFGERSLCELTDRVNVPPTTVDAVIVGKALYDASAYADGYLATRYALPLATIPPALVPVTIDIAWYYLNRDRVEKDDPIERAFAAGRSWLKDVAAGTVRLDTGGAEPETATTSEIFFDAPERRFTRNLMRGL